MAGWGRRWVAVVAVVALGIGAGLVSAGVARADSGRLVEVGTARFVVHADGSAITARNVTTIKNVDTRVTADNPGGRWVYKTYNQPIPVTAEGVKVTAGGKELKATVGKGTGPTTDNLEITLPDLKYQQSITMELTYTIKGGPLRSTSRTSVGKGYAAFGPIVMGDAGQAKLEIEAPSGFELHASEGSFTSASSGATTVWTATKNTTEYGIWSFVVLRDPKVVDERVVEQSEGSATIRALPGDKEWLDDTEKLMRDAMPKTEAITGLPWSSDITLFEQLESTTGKPFTVNLKERTVGIQPQLKAFQNYRQAMIAAFGDSTFAQRWVQEGLSSYIAFLATGASEDELVTTTPGGEGGGLSAWKGYTDNVMALGETDYYVAAHAVMRLLLDPLDDKQRTAVIKAAIQGESAYEEPGSPEGRQPTDERRFLDLVDERGGGNGAEIYSQWVTSKKDAGTLTARAEARTSYRDLDEADGSWRPPTAVRTAMAAWDFGKAKEAMASVADLAKTAGDLQRSADSAGIELPALAKDAYEKADAASASSAEDVLNQASVALTELSSAIASAKQDGGPFVALGRSLLGADGKLDRAREAFAAGDFDSVRTEVEAYNSAQDNAGLVGIGVIVGGLVLLAAVAVAIVVVLRRRRGAASAGGKRQPPAGQPGPAATQQSQHWQQASQPGPRAPWGQQPPQQGPQAQPPQQGPQAQPPQQRPQAQPGPGGPQAQPGPRGPQADAPSQQVGRPSQQGPPAQGPPARPQFAPPTWPGQPPTPPSGQNR